MLPIVLKGARTHNLQSIDLKLVPGELVAVTGPSGAGKSSLAMDTLYAEGQRRFVESFSPYARQFLERLERPPIDKLDPVAASVAVDRRAPVKSSRSTLSTMADLEPYFAALFAREAVPRCPDCDRDAVATTPEKATKTLLAKETSGRAVVSYPVRAEDADQFLELRESLVRDGYRRLLVGGRMRDIDEVRPSEATAPDVRVEVILDRVALRKDDARRLQHAIETAWLRGEGRAELRITDATQLALDENDSSSMRRVSVSRGLVCPKCSRSFDEPRPGLFSYNSPLGACTSCKGFGRIIAIDWDKVIPDPSKPLSKNAIKAWSGSSAEWERGVLETFCKKKKIPWSTPWEKLTKAQRDLVIEGEGSWKGGKYPGVKAWFKWLEGRTYKMHVRVFLARYRQYAPCPACHAARLNPTALAYRVGGMHIGQWHALSVSEARARLAEITPRDPQGKRVHEELAARFDYLEAVGLGYLTLDRQARTLSGGESQRAGLTTALGASLTGSMFVLDEPTVGLHASDVPPLTRAMRHLAEAGNAVVVIEHDRSVVSSSDRVVELGPGAGKNGGKILFDGPPEKIAEYNNLPTAKAWQREDERASNRATRKKAKRFLRLHGIEANNLQGVDVDIPLGVVCAVTGPSGSGKSTLVDDVVYCAVGRALGDMGLARPAKHDRLEGIDALARVVLVDQAPLGRTARGNAATYTHAWDRIRARFAMEQDAIIRGFTPSHFSFNVPAGRCETCSGEGYETVEMQFLADVSLLCPVCRGRRFKQDVLDVKFRGKSIADVLEMTIEDAVDLFDPPGAPSIERDAALRRALAPVMRVGLGYLPLGQPLSMLSGGEAQRLKLARALSEESKNTLYLIDEPSAGLHGLDTGIVIDALHALVEEGASVVVVEHDLDVIRAADWVIDLGPGGGPHGGKIVAEGAPEDVAKSDTKTGHALRDVGAKTHVTKSEMRATGPDAISVHHAREHNLKDVSCDIPRGKLCVVTGPSGSGKSSLAFDVIFAEGQRRFMETLTPYARQFLPTLPRPDVDKVTGVPPSIALEQRISRAGANSTVATVTEVAHYLRLLYAKAGEMHCPKCDALVAPLSPDDLFERLTKQRGNKTIYSPAVRARKGTYLDLFVAAARTGVKTARVDGAIVAIAPPPKLAKTKEHTIDLIVHYGNPSSFDRASFDRAIAWGAGGLRVANGPPAAKPTKDEETWSTARSCQKCGAGVAEVDPRWFSFNTKQGQCETCEGSGVAPGYGPQDARQGALGDSNAPKCKSCGGARLATLPRNVRLFGERYHEFCARDVAGALAMTKAWKFSGRNAVIAEAPHGELARRLQFIADVGLGYLALDRPASTLSGGEMQRLRLSAQLGSGLTGALYVLDEPTIGLHPRDTRLLLANLRALTECGSTVLVVEHDAETIAAADHVIDLGPGGGRSGGHIIAAGPATRVLSDERSPTARALRETGKIQRPKRSIADRWTELSGATANNLKSATLRIPAGRMTVVAGVSGSGKSTLVRGVFYPAVRKALGLVADPPMAFEKLKGEKWHKRALAVDQSPIGRTPRSVPATFLGVFDEIRRLFASLPESKVRGYTPARFSFNGGAGGRCQACQGQGAIVAEMAFLPDVISPCEACGGARFEPATLDIRYAGLSIGDVLHLSAQDAADVFKSHPKIARPLATLTDLGVGYVQIGQGSNTLSGGEAQRLKLAAELTAGVAHEPTLYVLDEPTTGLHLSDVKRLISVLDRLVERGDTLVIVEHHPD
ncbi:MAG: excinuclease ABC subunit UvrA, partial [Polyangiaceae bacterium]